MLAEQLRSGESHLAMIDFGGLQVEKQLYPLTLLMKRFNVWRTGIRYANRAGIIIVEYNGPSSSRSRYLSKIGSSFLVAFYRQ